MTGGVLSRPKIQIPQKPKLLLFSPEPRTANPEAGPDFPKRRKVEKIYTSLYVQGELKQDDVSLTCVCHTAARVTSRDPALSAFARRFRDRVFSPFA
jgi:hypothetical protein